MKEILDIVVYILLAIFITYLMIGVNKNILAKREEQEKKEQEKNNS